MATRRFIQMMSVIVLTALIMPLFAQTGSRLFEKGLLKEQGEGDLKGAIAIYEKVVGDKKTDRVVAAKAQLQIGLCYEKLGLEEAERAYRLVLENFSDQTELVAVANEKLMKLERARSAAEGEDKAFRIREVYSADYADCYDVSPDGRYLSSIHWSTISVHVHDMQTGEIWPISEKGTWKKPNRFPDASIWHPDSRQVAYYWYDGHAIELRISNRDGTDKRVVKRGSEEEVPWPAYWSRDGKMILGTLHRVIQENPREIDHLIALLNVDDGSVKIIKPQDGRHCRNYVLAPDNSYVLCDFQHSDDDEAKDIVKIDVDTGAETKIVYHPANDYAPFLTPEGDYLIFLSNRTGSYGLWGMMIENGNPIGEPVLLKGDLGESFNPYTLTTKGSLMYKLWSQAFDVKAASVDFKSGQVISQPEMIAKRFEGKNFMPFWSPDGNYLAYGSWREKDWRLQNIYVIKNLETGEERDLVTDLMIGASMGEFKPRWTPDSKSLLIDGRVRRYDDGFYLVDIETGKRTTILEKDWAGPLECGDWPQMAPDRNSIYYLHGDHKKVMKYDMSSGKKTVVYESQEVIYFNTLSPDGQYLAFRLSFDNPNQLWLLPVDGEEPRIIGRLDEEEKIDWPEWTPDSRQVIVIARNTEDLYAFSVDGGKPFKLDLELKNIRYLSIHPDGKRLAFTQRLSGSGSMFVMENFLPEKK